MTITAEKTPPSASSKAEVATAQQLAWSIERLLWGSVGDLRRLGRFNLLDAALADAHEAKLLSPERRAELIEQLDWFAETRGSSALLASL